MAVCVIDIFEPIKVKTEHGYTVSSFWLRQHLPQPLVELQSVGQIGQRIVLRHMGNFRLVSSRRSVMSLVATLPPVLMGELVTKISRPSAVSRIELMTLPCAIAAQRLA